jgi:hypothetical protein
MTAKHAIDVPCPTCHAPGEIHCTRSLVLGPPEYVLVGEWWFHVARSRAANPGLHFADPGKIDRTMDLYRDFAKAGIRWTLANRIADAKADALNALDVKMSKRLAWLDENPGAERTPTERVDDVVLLAKREDLARELADACAREAEADEALHKMATTLTLELER